MMTAAALGALVVALFASGCSSNYSVNTDGGSAVYEIGNPLPNDDRVSVVTVYRTGYAVAVTVRVPSGVSFPSAPGAEASAPQGITMGPFTDWSGNSLDPGVNVAGDYIQSDGLGLLTDDQIASLKCVLKAEQPFKIQFVPSTDADRYTVKAQDEIVPSRDENNLGTVINADCSVTVLEEASVSAVYLEEVNTVQ